MMKRVVVVAAAAAAVVGCCKGGATEVDALLFAIDVQACEGLNKGDCKKKDKCMFADKTCTLKECSRFSKEHCNARRIGGYRCSWEKDGCSDKACEKINVKAMCTLRDDCTRVSKTKCATEVADCTSIGSSNVCSSLDYCAQVGSSCTFLQCEDLSKTQCKKNSHYMPRCKYSSGNCQQRTCKQIEVDQVCTEREDCVWSNNKCKDAPVEPETDKDEGDSDGDGDGETGVTSENETPESGTPDSNYGLKVQMKGLDDHGLSSSMKKEIEAAFEEAAAKWKSVIVEPVGFPDINPALYDRSCFDMFHFSDIKGKITDLTIIGVIDDIDGPGQVVGSAGPCAITRTMDNRAYPRLGGMRFDIADVESMITRGLFKGVVLHEMGHVLGLGTLWSGPYGHELVKYSGGRYVWNEGDNTEEANASVLGEDGKIDPIIENDGGQGTAGGHWDERYYDDELMTGYVGGSMALSDLTVGALKDMGYGVNEAAADEWQAPLASARRKHSSDELLKGCQPKGDVFVFDENNNDLGRISV